MSPRLPEIPPTKSCRSWLGPQTHPACLSLWRTPTALVCPGHPLAAPLGCA